MSSDLLECKDYYDVTLHRSHGHFTIQGPRLRNTLIYILFGAKFLFCAGNYARGFLDASKTRKIIKKDNNNLDIFIDF